jgi:hypothetical protein
MSPANAGKRLRSAQNSRFESGHHVSGELD